MEQSEHDVRLIERQYEQAPDEPYPSRDDPYGEARECLKDALAALDDPDPEDALRAAREAIARIQAAL
jgi:hypothetical protein